MLMILLVAPRANAQQVAPLSEPGELGLLLPEAPKVVASKGETVMVRTPTGKSTVARLHCSIDDLCLVIMPDGKIAGLQRNEVRPTTDEFRPATPQGLAGSFKQGRFADYSVESTDRYLFLYSCSSAFYHNTRSILESLYPGVIALLRGWQIPLVEPDVPLVVVIAPNREEFDALRRMPPDVLAYYNTVDNRIVLYEDPALSDFAPELALKQAAYTIAHEGVHQILHNVGVQQRLSRWPAWLSEGLPEYLCPIKVHSSVVKERDAALPKRTLTWQRAGMVNDLRMHSLLEISGGSGDIVETVIHAPSLASGGYAIAWGLVHYLASAQPKAFRAYLRDVQQLGPLQTASGQWNVAHDALFVKHFGDDYTTLEQGVQRHLTQRSLQKEYRDPLVYQTHYVVVHSARQGRKSAITAFVTTSPDGARKWKESQELATKQWPKGTSHSFRTQVFDTQREAEAMLAKIGR